VRKEKDVRKALLELTDTPPERLDDPGQDARSAGDREARDPSFVYAFRPLAFHRRKGLRGGRPKPPRYPLYGDLVDARL
jgi:hypothetical protein